MITIEEQLAPAIPKNGSVLKKIGDLPHPFAKKWQEKSQSSKSKIVNEITVFLVDDDKFFLNGLYYFLHDSLSPKIKLKMFSTADECFNALHENPEIIVLDYTLSTDSSEAANGLSVLKKVNQISPATFVIMLSAQENIDIALKALNDGAYDYLSKSETAFIRLKNMIKNISETISENIELKKVEKMTKRINLFVILFLILLLIIGKII